MDQFTKGRVDFGIARGIDTRASIQFNLNADRRDQGTNYNLFAESLDVIMGAWDPGSLPARRAGSTNSPSPAGSSPTPWSTIPTTTPPAAS